MEPEINLLAYIYAIILAWPEPETTTAPDAGKRGGAEGENENADCGVLDSHYTPQTTQGQ